MPVINQLSDALINKIAAGEVIERPASVVKELVENSLDAFATQIDIDLMDGGKKGILVRDNGQGVPAAELELAVSRHATSKIKTDDDLFSIHTLGFRGEALASIASVSKMTLTSKRKGEETPGREIRIEGGRILSQEDTGHADGTSVSVKFLFYQTPARLKFLKTTETETAHIVDFVTRLALVHPEVGFTLSHHGKKILDLRPADALRRIESVFGKEAADFCYPVSSERGGMKIAGYAGNPNLSRSHNRHVFLFVNGRAVRDKVLYHAIFESYRDLIMRGRYPFVVLFVEVPPEMVDVNVHPAKSEVRFSNSAVVHRFVYESIRKVLQEEPWKKSAEKAPATEPQPFPTEFQSENSFKEWALTPRPESPGDDNQFFLSLRRQEAASPAPAFTEWKKVEFGQRAFADLEVIGQCLATFILCQSEGRLVLIDQHAAHERIGFEKILKQYQESQIPSEPLLIPENFDLSPSEAEVLKKYLPDLEKIGLEIDFFGGNTFVVKRLPVFFKNRVVVKNLMLDLIGDALEKGKLTSIQDNLHAVFARMACHGAIRANHRLTHDEMRALLKELDQYSFTSFCPHGRPVSVEVTRDEIDRWFKRVL